MSVEKNDLIVAGLGNPGAEYAGSRHNLGFRVVEDLSRRLNAPAPRKRWRSLTSSVELGGRTVWLLQPQTFMNLSGRAIAESVRDLGADPDQVWVVYDELDLPLCRLRIRLGGSAAGNNGVKSVIASLGSQDFWRFRVGVGKPPSPRRGVDYVLGRFSKAEAERVPAVVEGVASAVEVALREGVDAAMRIYNRRDSLGCEELP